MPGEGTQALEAGPATIRVGLAGWDYPDWRGIVYPKKKTKSFDELGYLARYFDTVEINSTFYRPADPKAAAGWVKRVEHNPAFKFTAKLWKRFTHERATAWTAEGDRARQRRAGRDSGGRPAGGGAAAISLVVQARRGVAGVAARSAGRVRAVPAGPGGAARQLGHRRRPGRADRARGRRRQRRPAALLEFDQAGRARHVAGRLRPPARAQLPGLVPGHAPAATSDTTTSTPPTSSGRGWSASGRWPRGRPSGSSTR